MPDEPQEMDAWTADVYHRVVTRGRALRRRRVAALVTGALVLLVPAVAAIGLTLPHDGGHVRVAAAGDSTTVDNASAPSSTVGTPSTTTPEITAPPASPETSEPPPTEPAPETTVPVPTTTPLVCRNSTDPACGDFYYDPPPTNEPASLEVVSVSPRQPVAGDEVTFTFRASDPDSLIVAGGCARRTSFGDGDDSGCAISCPAPGIKYGPWDPPPPQPTTLTFTLTHTYEKAGSYQAEFSIEADECGPRPSAASASVTVNVSP